MKIRDLIVMYVYFSNALYSHSIPIRLKKRVDETSIYNGFSDAILGMVIIVIPRITYVIMVEMVQIIDSSCTVRDSFSLLDLYFELIFSPYVGRPNWAK